MIEDKQSNPKLQRGYMQRNRMQLRAYARIDLKPANEIDPALADLCRQWGIQSVWLPFNRFDAPGTRAAISRYLLGDE